MRGQTPPAGPLHAGIDGRVGDYFEWRTAGHVRLRLRRDARRRSGSRASSIFGTDGRSLFVRIDPFEPGALDGATIVVRQAPDASGRGLSQPGPGLARGPSSRRSTASSSCAVPLDGAWRPQGAPVRFAIELRTRTGATQRIPADGFVELAASGGRSVPLRLVRLTPSSRMARSEGRAMKTVGILTGGGDAPGAERGHPRDRPALAAARVPDHRHPPRLARPARQGNRRARPAADLRDPAPRRNDPRHVAARTRTRTRDDARRVEANFKALGLDALDRDRRRGHAGRRGEALGRGLSRSSASRRRSTTISRAPTRRSGSTPRSRSRPRRSTGCTRPRSPTTA